MTTEKMSFTEALDTVNGFDELAVQQHFGIDLYVGNDAHPMTAMRAMIFVLKRREGLTDPQAKEATLRLTVKECNDFFEAEPDELDPEQPDSAAGKDSSEPDAEPKSLLASAS